MTDPTTTTVVLHDDEDVVFAGYAVSPCGRHVLSRRTGRALRRYRGNVLLTSMDAPQRRRWVPVSHAIETLTGIASSSSSSLVRMDAAPPTTCDVGTRRATTTSSYARVTAIVGLIMTLTALSCVLRGRGDALNMWNHDIVDAMSAAPATNLFVSKVWVLHSPALTLRKATIDKLRGMFESTTTQKRPTNAVVEVLEDNEPSSITSDNVSKLAQLGPTINGVTLDPPFDKLATSITIKQLSNALKHATALRRVADDDDTDAAACRYHLIVEDDVLFGDNVREAVESAARVAMNEGWDVVWLGLPQVPTYADGTLTNPKLHNIDTAFAILPCCDAYLVSPTAARKLLEQSPFVPIRFPTHIHISWATRRAKLRCAMARPNIFVDGSKLGVYVSSINVDNRLLWNEQYARVDSALRKLSSSATADERTALLNLLKAPTFKTMVDDMHFRDHPDVKYIKGLYYFKVMQDVNVAKGLFDAAYALYIREGVQLNRTGSFLRDYCSMFAHVQTQDDVLPPPDPIPDEWTHSEPATSVADKA